MTGLPSLPNRFTFRVVGVTFDDAYPENLVALDLAAARAFLDGRAPEAIAAVLLREPDNPHDPAAVGVHVPALGAQIGHVPRHLAARLAPRLDRGETWAAEVVEVLTSPERPNQPGVNVRVRRIPDDVNRS